MILTFIRDDATFIVDTESSTITLTEYDEHRWTKHVTECYAAGVKIKSVDHFLECILNHTDRSDVPLQWIEEIERYAERDLLE